jgi:SAM-dependent methyltransferase
MRTRVIIDQKAQREHFDTLKNRYDAERLESAELHTELELESLATAISCVAPDKRVVDFGAGTGRCCLYLLRKGYSVEAVDLSEASLAALQQNAERLDLPQIKTRTELPSEPYADAIVGTDVLHHVQLDETVNRFYAALVGGGRISFSEPGAGNLFWYLYLGVYRREWKVERGIVQCSHRNLTRALRDAGFINIRVRGFGFFPNPLFNWSPTLCRLNLRLGNAPLLRHFAYRYLITAEKPVRHL